MPNDLKDRPGNQYQDQDAWYRGGGSDDPAGDLNNGGLNNSPETGDNIPGKTSKEKNSGLDGGALANKEADSPNAGSTANAIGGEKLGKGFTGGVTDGLAKATPMGRVAQITQLLGNKKGQATGVAGLMITLAFLVFGFLGSSLELIHVRQNFTGAGSSSSTFALKNRRVKAVAGFVNQFNKNNIASLEKTATYLSDGAKLNPTAFASELQSKGFTVATGADNEILKISKTLKNGTSIGADYAAAGAAGTLDNEIANFARAGGSELASSIDSVSSAAAGKWSGPFAKNLYRGRLTSSLKNWLGNVKPDPDPEARSTAAKVAEAPEAKLEPGRSGTGAIDTATNGDGQPSTNPETGAPAEGTPINAVDELAGAVDDSVDNAFGDLVEASAESAAKGAAESTSEGLGKLITKAAAKSATATAKSSALGFIDATQWAQVGCKAIGTLQYVASVRNIQLSIELARFSLRYLNAADSQKAGLLSGEGLAIFFKYLRQGSSSGKNYNGSPGLLYAMGDRSQVVSSKSRTQFSTGRENAGVFGMLNSFLESVPGLNTSGRARTCKVVSNGWFQVGALAVGAVIAVVTFGTGNASFGGAQSFIMPALQATATIAIEIAGPMLARTGKHLVMSKLTEGLSIGDALGSGMGALQAMNNNTNSLLIADKQQSAALRLAAKEDYKRNQASHSLYERYLSLDKSDSLVSKLASAASNLTTPGAISTTTVAKALSPEKFIGGTFNSAVYAASSSQCTDPELTKYATDPFCNTEISIAPDLDMKATYDLLLANKHIDTAGKPISDDFKGFIKNCATGAPSVIYNNNVRTDGGTVNLTIDDCTSDSVTLNGETETTNNAYAYIYNNQPKQSYFAQFFGQRAFAAPESKLVSQRERFAAWQGYVVDTKTLASEFGTLEEDNGTASTPATAPTTPAPSNPTIPSGTVPIEDTIVVEGIRVNRSIADQTQRMLAAMKADGLIIAGSSGWRDSAGQIALRRQNCGPTDYDIYQKPSTQCKPWTAIPGSSNHQKGLAIDFACNGGSVSRSGPCFIWLQKNAATYGYKNLPKEPWHWSIDGK